MRSGQVVTLARMFQLGCGSCTAYDIYKEYMNLPILAHRRKKETKSWRDAWGTSSGPAHANKKRRRSTGASSAWHPWS